MKNSWEWDENDLLELVNAKTKESIELDFKDSASLQNTDRKKEEISKDVSAFANSAGGTLLYGMREDSQTHVASGLDTGSDPSVITKEWLEQVINSTIHRKIDGIRIHQVELTKTSPGKVAYVVYVPQSTRTAHQAANNKYYKRYNFQSVPMEEYEVRDLYLRGDVPDLRIQFLLPKTELTINQENMLSQFLGMDAGIYNDSLEPANYAVIRIIIDARLNIANAQDLSAMNGVQLRIEERFHPVNILSLNWNIPVKMPIFQQPYAFSITNNGKPILLRTSTDGRMGNHVSYLLGYEIASPRMMLKSEYRLLHVKSGYATLAADWLSTEELAANYENLGF